MQNINTYYNTITDPERLDKLAANLSGISRSQIAQLIKAGKVLVDDVPALDRSEIISRKCKIDISENITERLEGITSKEMDLNIVFEDKDLIVINKPSGLTVHPGAGNYDDTLVNGLLHKYKAENLSSVNDETRPGIVHRLDRDTSGLMVVAKNNISHTNLSKQIETREAKRSYLALVWGFPKVPESSIEMNITRNSGDRTRMMAVTHGGKTAITHYSVKEIFCNGLFSLVEARLETGRTHQIRVHMSHIGHSVVGDQVYGNNQRKANSLQNEDLRERLLQMKRQALHAYKLSFFHPSTGDLMEFTSDIQEDMSELLVYLRSI